MKISFDLDDTILVPESSNHKEPNSFSMERFSINEYFRKGSFYLWNMLKAENHELGVYTNSYRGKTQIENWFQKNNLSLDFIINQQIHDIAIQGAPITETENKIKPPNKMPSLFNIDLHIDDLEEIKQQNIIYPCHVFIVLAQDSLWAEKVLEKAKEISRL